jgi:hypothetical protein
MLGCHDFCGHYEWTFHYVRRRWGQAAIARLWAEAIGGESQRHYADAAQRAGLRGLYETWTKTGEDECCDWTFTLDEPRNVLRCDMRACPSKGFLIQNDLNADEDYCDHCLGWIGPLLDHVGAEVLEHEHNHCGQCWMTIRMKDRPSEPLDLAIDIRRDPHWNHGYLDRWQHGLKQPFLPAVSESADPCDALEAWFAATGGHPVLVTDATYVREPARQPSAVLIGSQPADLPAVARRFLGTLPQHRPLLLHAYLPSAPRLDFVTLGLPRPVPILPLLIRKNLYTHRPGGPAPTIDEFLELLTQIPNLRFQIPDLKS